MAGSIKGIIVEIGGDTSGLQKALKDVNSKTASLSKELRGINSLLKLDPKNTELLAQKQDVLNQSIKTTEDKLRELQSMKAEYDKKMAEGTAINEENYRYLQREIINTQNKLKDLKTEASDWTKASEKLMQWGENLEDIGSKIDNLGNKLTTRLTVPITALAGAGIKYNAEIEKMTTAYETFLGNAKEADKVVTQIKNDAAKTPFDATSLIKANQMLISTGENAEDSQQTILALGEAITATGGGNDELTRMASNLQQIKNAGKATSMDIRQFAYAGIDVYGLLADYTGKTTAEVKDMEVSYEDLSGALQKASKQGGKYYGAMDKASQTLTGQTKQLVAEFKDMTGELTKSLMPAAKKVIKIIKDLVKKFDGLSDSQKENIVKIGLMVAAAGPLLKIGSTAISTIGNVTKGVGTLTKTVGLLKNGIGNATGESADLVRIIKGLFSPTGIATMAIVAGVTITVREFQKATEETRKYKKACEDSANEVLNQKRAIEELRSSIDSNMQTELNHIDRTQQLWEELKKITNENGKVKEGYENRARVITGELSEALGTEITMTGNVIDKYKTLQKEIDTLILKKKGEIIINGAEEKYNEALSNRDQYTQQLIDKQDELNKAKEKEIELQEKYNKGVYTGNIAYDIGQDKKNEQNWKNQQEAVKNLENEINNLQSIINGYTADIEDYQHKYELFTEGTTESIQQMVDEVGKTYEKNGQTVAVSFDRQIKAQQYYLDTAKELNKKAIENNNETEKAKTQATIDEAERRLDVLIDELKGMTSTVNENSDDVVNSWKTLANDSYDVYVETVKELPVEMQNTIQTMTGVIVTETPKVLDKTNGLADEIIGSLDKNQEIKNLAVNELKSFIVGLSDEQQRRLLKDAGIKNTEAVMDGLKQGNLSEETGIEILKGLGEGLDNNYWKNQIFSRASSIASRISGTLSNIGINTSTIPGHKNGLDYVPYDNYIARLHKGERVLTAEENKHLIDMEKASRLNNKASLLNNQIKQLDKQKMIFTTPNITFNVQKMDEANLNSAFNYINRRLGSQY